MGTVWDRLVFHIDTMTPLDILVAFVDVVLIAYIIYRIILLIRGTRAIHLVQGLAILLTATVISGWLSLSAINWALEQVQISLLVAIPIVFQPELRRALEQVGRGRLFGPGIAVLERPDLDRLIQDLVRAVKTMSRNKVGALIVLERETGLEDVAETGIRIDGRVSAEFLVNIFIPNTPLHDGAVIIRGNRVVAAACFLPLTESEVDPKMGGRHRASLGITEQTDAVVLVVSEENGAISLARGGKLIRNLDEESLREMLSELLVSNDKNSILSYFSPSGGGTGE